MSYTRRIVGVIGGGGGGTTVVSGMAAVSLLGNNTSGALALVSSGTLRLAGGNNITLSQNGQSVTISGAANAGGGTLSMWENLSPLLGAQIVASRSLSQSSLGFFPLYFPVNISASQMMNLFSISVSVSSNSSFAAAFSQSAGIYTLTGSTLNLITASSGATNFQFTNTASGSTASLSGWRGLINPISVSATPGNYWIGIVEATATTNANWATVFNMKATGANSLYLGTWGSVTNASMALVKGVGIYSAQTAALPASVNISADLVSGSSWIACLPPYMQFQGF